MSIHLFEVKMRYAYTRFLRPTPSISLLGRRDQPRPIISVGLIGPSNSFPCDAQIDSGSDETFFPEFFATMIGLDLTNAPTESFKGQGGGRLTARFAYINLRISDGIEFREWPAWVGFVSTNLSRPVLGFGGFLQFFDATFRGADEAVELRVNHLYSGT
jgi:hypothetical protein